MASRFAEKLQASSVINASITSLIRNYTMHKEYKGLPLEGVRVVEFTHMVMGPTCGMILAD
jgi:hypothetical protein